MRRWFIHLLAILITAQFGWAVAATYCGHEAAAAGGGHFGHHADTHSHQVTKAHKAGGSDQVQAGDLDHGHCHLAQVAIGSDPQRSFDADHSALSGSAKLLLTASHIPDGLDRPNWLRA